LATCFTPISIAINRTAAREKYGIDGDSVSIYNIQCSYKKGYK
jgi:hypothetical protein